jgi:hypothetical protein
VPAKRYVAVNLKRIWLVISLDREGQPSVNYCIPAGAPGKRITTQKCIGRLPRNMNNRDTARNAWASLGAGGPGGGYEGCEGGEREARVSDHVFPAFICVPVLITGVCASERVSRCMAVARTRFKFPLVFDGRRGMPGRLDMCSCVRQCSGVNQWPTSERV